MISQRKKMIYRINLYDRPCSNKRPFFFSEDHVKLTCMNSYHITYHVNKACFFFFFFLKKSCLYLHFATTSSESSTDILYSFIICKSSTISDWSF